MTYRERREAKAERLREWAAKREAKATALHDQADRLASAIPFGQPILVGHHSEGRDRRYRARIGATMDRAVENDRTAARMASRADGIRAQNDGAIYDDDPDAIEQLTAKLAELEAERAAIVAYNKTARAGRPDPTGLAPKWAHRADGNPLPAYATNNLGGNIKRTRDRLARLTARRERTGSTAKPARPLSLKYAGTCADCGASLAVGIFAYYDRSTRSVTCQPCHEGTTR